VSGQTAIGWTQFLRAIESGAAIAEPVAGNSLNAACNRNQTTKNAIGFAISKRHRQQKAEPDDFR
jgi:hypothetical protein